MHEHDDNAAMSRKEKKVFLWRIVRSFVRSGDKEKSNKSFKHEILLEKEQQNPTLK